MSVAEQDCHVRIRNLCRSFTEGDQRHDVIHDLNLDVATGQTVALRGRSGSGKSTLLNLISGIDIPDAGDIAIGGQSITDMTETERTLYRRKHIGFVYQAFNLVPTLTVANNVRLVLELNDVPRERANIRIGELLDAVELGNRADSYPDVLSGGEQQRVAIARALSHQPALVLADEPTGNLDDNTATAILALLDRLVRQSGKTMIIATHSAAVAGNSDRVLELHDGIIRP